MTLDTIQDTPRSASAASRILLSSDNRGGWNLTGPTCPTRRFADFAAALDSARQVPAAKTATIEIWRGGEYICCLPPEDGTDLGVSVRAPTVCGGFPCAGAVRQANRAAQVVFATVGPLFWLALMLVAVAATFGPALLHP